MRLEIAAPISYSVAREQLHHALAGYKRLGGDVARRLRIELAAVLWRYLADHEQCVAAAAGVPAFDIVATVPSSDRRRDERQPCAALSAEIVLPTRDRYERLLTRSSAQVEERASARTSTSPPADLRASPCSSSTTPGRPAPTRKALPPRSGRPGPA